MYPQQRNIARDSCVALSTSIWSFTRKDIEVCQQKCLPTAKAATGSGILARPMEQLPRFHGGTVTTQMRNLYRCGKGRWQCLGDGGENHCFRKIVCTKNHVRYPWFLSLGIIMSPQFGNHHVTTNWCFQQTARFRHTGFAVFSVPGHLRCSIGAIFPCNSVLRIFRLKTFKSFKRLNIIKDFLVPKIQNPKGSCISV